MKHDLEYLLVLQSKINTKGVLSLTLTEIEKYLQLIQSINDNTKST